VTVSSQLSVGEFLQVRGSGEGANEREKRVPEGPQAFICRSDPSLGWTTSDAIGRHGQCLGTASCSRSRGQVGRVGGWSVRP
jgi:hypothetical protein